MSMAIRPFARSLGLAVAAVLLATSGLASTATPSLAAGYIYHPGDVMYFGGPLNHGAVSMCTGGYIITGASGTFLTTDGHCAEYGQGSPGYSVYGTQRAFGTVAYSKWWNAADYGHAPPGDMDTELISEYTTDDRWQTVRNPWNGQLANGTGKVVSYARDQELAYGVVVGKMGVTSGQTFGRIVGTTSYYNMLAYCSTASALPGDSGGPVWQPAAGGGVKAVGLTVAGNLQVSCFLSISDLLYVWGATSFPVWASGSSGAKTAIHGPGHAAQVLPALPRIDPATLHSLVGTAR